MCDLLKEIPSSYQGGSIPDEGSSRRGCHAARSARMSKTLRLTQLKCCHQTLQAARLELSFRRHAETRPCERCVKYGLQDCVDSTRKPRKSGLKR